MVDIRLANEDDIEEVLKIVGEEPEENIILIADLTQLRDWCDVRVAVNNNEIKGVFALYKDLDFIAGAFWTESTDVLRKLIDEYGEVLKGAEMIVICTNSQLDLIKPVAIEVKPREERQMVMEDPDQLTCKVSFPTHRLTTADIDELREIYRLSGTPAWTPNALHLGPFFGVKDESGKIVAVAGVHFMSKYGTEIGNVATHPDHRRKGYAQCCVAAVTKEVLKESDRVVLHFFGDNTGAQKMYEKMGFAYSIADPVYFTKITLP